MMEVSLPFEKVSMINLIQVTVHIPINHPTEEMLKWYQYSTFFDRTYETPSGVVYIQMVAMGDESFPGSLSWMGEEVLRSRNWQMSDLDAEFITQESLKRYSGLVEQGSISRHLMTTPFPGLWPIPLVTAWEVSEGGNVKFEESEDFEEPSYQLLGVVSLSGSSKIRDERGIARLGLGIYLKEENNNG